MEIVRLNARPPGSRSETRTTAFRGRVVSGRLGDRQRHGRRPLAVGGHAFQLDAFLTPGFCDQAELIAGVIRIGPEVLAQEHLGIDRQTGGRRAVQIAAIDLDAVRLARHQGVGFRLQGHFQLLGDEILDLETDPADRLPFRVDIGSDLPAAGPRRLRHRDGQGIAAGFAVGLQGEAARFDAVRTEQAQGQGQAGDRDGLLVAQQGTEMNRLARAVNTAFGIEEGIDRPWRDPAGHAAVRQIEGRAGEVQEVVIAAVGRHSHRRRAVAPGAPGQAWRELDPAGGIGRCRAQNLVVAGDEADGNAGHRLRRRERPGEDGQAVLAAIGRDAEVADHQPLGRPASVALLVVHASRPAGHRRPASAV